MYYLFHNKINRNIEYDNNFIDNYNRVIDDCIHNSEYTVIDSLGIKLLNVPYNYEHKICYFQYRNRYHSKLDSITGNKYVFKMNTNVSIFNGIQWSSTSDEYLYFKDNLEISTDGRKYIANISFKDYDLFQMSVYPEDSSIINDIEFYMDIINTNINKPESMDIFEKQCGYIMDGKINSDHGGCIVEESYFLYLNNGNILNVIDAYNKLTNLVGENNICIKILNNETNELVERKCNLEFENDCIRVWMKD